MALDGYLALAVVACAGVGCHHGSKGLTSGPDSGGEAGTGGASGTLTVPDASPGEDSNAAGPPDAGSARDTAVVSPASTGDGAILSEAGGVRDAVHDRPGTDGGLVQCLGTPVLGGLLPMTETGNGPVRLAVGDLNGDGLPDIVTANDSTRSSSKSVSVLLGRGNGTFATSIDYDVDYHPWRVAMGDMNGDGKLDLVVSSHTSTGAPTAVVDVWLGQGDGSFGARYAYSTASTGSFALVLGDLDGDGKLDIATADSYENKVSVFLGRGDGTLAPRQDYPTGTAPSALAFGDLDADGRLDMVAVTTRSPAVNVFLGHGDGSFAERTEFPLPVYPFVMSGDTRVALGDLNGDGKLDLVAAMPTVADGVSVALGHGDGTFEPLAILPPIGVQLASLSLLDLNDDGRLDLVLGLAHDGVLSVRLGHGDGSFAEAVDYLTGTELRDLVAGDFNQDGKPDLALLFESLAYDSGALGVSIGQGDGTFASPLIQASAGGWVGGLALGDLNGDNKLDMVVAGSSDDVVGVRLGRGDGSFAVERQYPTGKGPQAVALGDLDGDGRLDLVTANASAASVSVLLQKGDGIFSAGLDWPTADRPTSVGLGDTNGDGRLDVITTNRAATDYEAGTVNVLLGTGDGRFFAPASFAAGVDPVSLALGDLNADGKLDLVVANRGDGFGSVSVLLGQGDGSFGTAEDASTTDKPVAVALADVSGDGKLDLVMASDYALAANRRSAVRVLRGKGDGTFAPAGDYPAWAGLKSLAVGEMNGDGTPDIVVASEGLIELLLGRGDGTFAPRLRYPARSWQLALGDLDGDGRLDLAMTTSLSSTSVLLRSCQ